jgi:hypothetical protein
VAKKLSEIETLVNESSHSFMEYLKKSFDKSIIGLLDEFSKKTNVFIFSGVIRNFFLNINDNRDLDIVLESPIEIEEFLTKTNFKLNSFGGYKFQFENTNIDLWFLDNTWSLKNHQLTLNFQLDRYIPQTAFFNFSAVMYSYNKQQFIYTKHFLRFLRDKKLEMVYAPNPNNALCIVNTFYYRDKLKMKIGEKLKEHIRKISSSNLGQTSSVQEKHFGEILYTEEELKKLIEEL